MVQKWSHDSVRPIRVFPWDFAGWRKKKRVSMIPMDISQRGLRSRTLKKSPVLSERTKHSIKVDIQTSYRVLQVSEPRAEGADATR